MEIYLGRQYHHQVASNADAEEERDFSINNEDVSDNIDQLAGSFENFKKTVSCGAVFGQIKQFEEINKRLDR